MSLSLRSPPPISRLHLLHSHHRSRSRINSSNAATALFHLVLSHDLLSSSPRFLFSAFAAALGGACKCKTKSSVSESETEAVIDPASELLDADLISRVSAAKDANEALEMIAENNNASGGCVVSACDCCLIISAALDRNNADLALSIFFAMRSTFDPATDESSAVERWKWSRPDMNVYTELVCGLARSLRISDAIRIISNVCRVGVSPGDEEVPFGAIVKCPTCMIAVAVAQPQHGIQNVSCSKCCYQYELVSGDIVNIKSEEIRTLDLFPRPF